jgi:photosystem II stability/assembly factor-like uncharacterized protein
LGLSFADRRTGWAFGAGLWLTRDGGDTWQLDRRLGSVQALVPLGSSVWAITTSCADTRRRACLQQLQTSSDAGRSWHVVSAQRPLTDSVAQLVRLSTYRAVLLSYGAGQLPAAAVSTTTDGGRTWHRVTAGCDGGDIGRLAALPPARLWLLCGDQPGAGSQPKQLFGSADGGASWRLLAGTDLGGPTGLPIIGYVGELSFPAAMRGWMILNRGGLYTTVDGGRSWHIAMEEPEVNPDDRSVGPMFFLDAQHGWLAVGSRVIRTTTGGATWTAVLLP